MTASSSPGDPRALGQLLRSRRERLTPAEVGLPVGARRRATGLRREEVAALANMSTTYYTFLEQGGPFTPSAQMLESLATALRMTDAERHYLTVLAHGPASHAAQAPAEEAAPGTGWLLHALEPAFTALIAELTELSPQVREWWPRHDVTPPGGGVKILRHNVFGESRYAHVVLRVADAPDQTLVVFHRE